MTPFFNAGPLEHPHVPIYIGAVGPYMARLAGELCDGICYHPFCTPKYFREVILPNIEAGARKAGRQVSDIGMWGGPMVAAGRNAAEVHAAIGGVKMNIAFYGSTRTYFPVLEAHGWLALGQRLHQLSIEGKWREMMELISDEVLHEFALVGTYDEIVPQLKERWGGIFSSLVIGLPRETPEDERRTRETIQALRQP
jgi:probable F420-dependent oxidoreductase